MVPLTQQLMQRAWNAEKLRRQKAAIKRIVTTLRKQSSELGPLLEHHARERDLDRKPLLGLARVVQATDTAVGRQARLGGDAGPGDGVGD